MKLEARPSTPSTRRSPSSSGVDQALTIDHQTHWSFLIIALLALMLLASCNAPMSDKPEAQQVTPFSAAPHATATPPHIFTTPTISERSPTPTVTPASRASPTTVAVIQPTALATAELIGELAPAPILPGTLVTKTAYLDLYRVEGGLLIPTVLEMAPDFEDAIRQVGLRLGAKLIGRVAISFEPPQTGSCALRGLTRSHERTIQLYYGPESSHQLVLSIVAHELAHELQHDYYGWDAHRRSDTILLEGQATWASADYSRGADGRPTWASAAEQALAEGQLLPLATDLERDCRRTTRNAAYTGWASFVDFLIVTYGREHFDRLYRSGNGHDTGSANYAKVYGKSLEVLDKEWRAWLAEAPRR
jgi:hypothetical protein